jgi:hypoxanthine-DNA glycosylase
MHANCGRGSIVCFDPIVDGKTKVLILGTLPGPESLKTGQYYKKNSNCFWKIIYALNGQSPPIDYCDRCSYLIENNIGVWDVLRYADRDGSSDTDIQNAEPNDFDMFLKKYPHIKGILFNGKEAEEQFRRFFPMIFRSIKHERVLSSSGALAKPFNVKLENWGNAINRMTK